MKQKPTNLAVENLEPSDPINHSFQLDPLDVYLYHLKSKYYVHCSHLDVLILPIHSLNSEDVIAEVQALEPEVGVM